MTVVGTTQKLCLGRNQSVNGPIAYSSAVPSGATITNISYTYNLSGGGTASDSRTPSVSCTDYVNQINPTYGSLDCDSSATVVLQSASCDPCTENTGTASTTGIAPGAAVWRCGSLAGPCPDGFTGCGGVGCVQTVIGWVAYKSSIMSGTGSTSFAASWTPGSTARPCNWTGLAFSHTFSITSSQTSDKGGTWACTFSLTVTKSAGSNALALSSATYSLAYNAAFDGQLGTYTATHGSEIWDVPCTGYRMRFQTTGLLTDTNVGGVKIISSASGPTPTLYLEPR